MVGLQRNLQCCTSLRTVEANLHTAYYADQYIKHIDMEDASSPEGIVCLSVDVVTQGQKPQEQNEDNSALLRLVDRDCVVP